MLPQRNWFLRLCSSEWGYDMVLFVGIVPIINDCFLLFRTMLHGPIWLHRPRSCRCVCFSLNKVKFLFLIVWGMTSLDNAMGLIEPTHSGVAPLLKQRNGPLTDGHGHAIRRPSAKHPNAAGKRVHRPSPAAKASYHSETITLKYMARYVLRLCICDEWIAWLKFEIHIIHNSYIYRTGYN